MYLKTQGLTYLYRGGWGELGRGRSGTVPLSGKPIRKKHLYLVYSRAKLVGDQHYRTTSFFGLQLQRYRGRVKNPIFLRYTVIRLAAYQAKIIISPLTIENWWCVSIICQSISDILDVHFVYDAFQLKMAIWGELRQGVPVLPAPSQFSQRCPSSPRSRNSYSNPI